MSPETRLNRETGSAGKELRLSDKWQAASRTQTAGELLGDPRQLVLRVIHTIHQAMDAPSLVSNPLHRRKPVPTAKVDPGLRRESAEGASSWINCLDLNTKRSALSRS